MIFFDGLLYRLSLKTAVRLRVHLQYYPHHMMPINRIPFLSGTIENVFIISIWLHFSLWMHIIFQSEMSAKISPSSSVFIHHHLLHSKTNTNTCVHTYFWKYVILEMFVGDLPKRFFIVFMSSSLCHHILRTLKQTQNFVFIHILQYVILELFAMDRFLIFHVCRVFSASSSSDWYMCSFFAFLFSFSKRLLILWLVELFSAWK